MADDKKQLEFGVKLETSDFQNLIRMLKELESVANRTAAAFQKIGMGAAGAASSVSGVATPSASPIGGGSASAGFKLPILNNMFAIRKDLNETMKVMGEFEQRFRQMTNTIQSVGASNIGVLDALAGFRTAAGGSAPPIGTAGVATSGGGGGGGRGTGVPVPSSGGMGGGDTLQALRRQYTSEMYPLQMVQGGLGVASSGLGVAKYANMAYLRNEARQQSFKAMELNAAMQGDFATLAAIREMGGEEAIVSDYGAKGISYAQKGVGIAKGVATAAGAYKGLKYGRQIIQAIRAMRIAGGAAGIAEGAVAGGVAGIETGPGAILTSLGGAAAGYFGTEAVASMLERAVGGTSESVSGIGTGMVDLLSGSVDAEARERAVAAVSAYKDRSPERFAAMQMYQGRMRQTLGQTRRLGMLDVGDPTGLRAFRAFGGFAGDIGIDENAMMSLGMRSMARFGGTTTSYGPQPAPDFGAREPAGFSLFAQAQMPNLSIPAAAPSLSRGPMRAGEGVRFATEMAGLEARGFDVNALFDPMARLKEMDIQQRRSMAGRGLTVSGGKVLPYDYGNYSMGSLVSSAIGKYGEMDRSFLIEPTISAIAASSSHLTASAAISDTGKFNIARALTAGAETAGDVSNRMTAMEAADARGRSGGPLNITTALNKAHLERLGIRDPQAASGLAKAGYMELMDPDTIRGWIDPEGKMKSEDILKEQRKFIEDKMQGSFATAIPPGTAAGKALARHGGKVLETLQDTGKGAMTELERKDFERRADWAGMTPLQMRSFSEAMGIKLVDQPSVTAPKDPTKLGMTPDASTGDPAAVEGQKYATQLATQMMANAQVSFREISAKLSEAGTVLTRTSSAISSLSSTLVKSNAPPPKVNTQGP